MRTELSNSLRRPRRPFLAALALLATALGPALSGKSAETGAEIYRRQCASCHGERGQGGEELGPLVGDLSVRELASYITEAMPEDEPEKCIGPDAEAVAAFIYDAFYSPTAQVRNQPPKIDLARLTVRQYRNSVADLVASFTGTRNWEGHGLSAEYFKSRRRRNEDRVIQRVDATVDFHFEDGSPDPDKIPAEEFLIRWEGSVLAPESGTYDFVVESENGFQLWVNERDTPLIDARVRSGDQTVYRQSIELLGGRAYPLRLEYTKSKADKSASIHLKWKPPSFAEQTIPNRHLTPSQSVPVLVVSTPFPPDDQSVGYERGVSVSKQWMDATTSAAIEVANKLMAHLDGIAKLPKEPEPRAKRLREFCEQWTTRAFRRPLTDELRQLYIDRHFEDAANADIATKRVLLLTLTSPRFLFPDAAEGEFDDHQVAAWLALAIWDSIPDQQLLDAAASGKLKTADELAAQAERMINDPRAKSKVQEFFRQWLKLDHFHDLTKTESKFPDFDDQLASDLRSSLEMFLEEAVWSGTSDFRDLLRTETVYLNDRLAEYYGTTLGEDSEAEYQPVVLDPGHRAGILTHPYLLAGFAYDDTSSPIHRGVFLARSLLGRFLKPPPEAVTPIPPDLHPDLTTRERVALQTKDVSCRACHGMINQLGFTLESFDAVGRFRELEQGRPIDASGGYITREGQEVKFAGASDLAEFLVTSPESHAAFSEQLFQYLIKQPVQAFGPEMLDQLQVSFQENGYNIRQLVREIAVQSALSARELNNQSSQSP